jgi:hypothetical protein
MSDPIDQRDLARMMDNAVALVRPRPDALTTIRRGVRRRRIFRRAAAAVTVVAAVTAGGVAYGAEQGGGSRPAPLSTPGVPATGHGVPVAAPTSPFFPPGTGTPSTPPAPPTTGPATGRTPLGDLSATITPVGNPRTTEHFLLVVHLPGGGTRSVPFSSNFDAAQLPPGPSVIGIVDAGPDGQPAIFVFTHRMADSTALSVFTAVGGRYTQVSMAGQPALLFMGGPVMAGDGFSCNDPGSDLAVTGYESAGPQAGSDTWTVYRTTYAWSGATLVQVHHWQSTVHALLGSPQLTQYSTVHCGNISNPRF